MQPLEYCQLEPSLKNSLTAGAQHASRTLFFLHQLLPGHLPLLSVYCCCLCSCAHTMFYCCSGLTPRADSIITMQLPEQLDYFSAMLQEEQQLQHKAGMQQQQDHFKSTQVQSTSTAFQSEGLQDLEPCDAEWIPAAAADSSLLGPLEDGPLDSDASPLQRYAKQCSC